MYFSATAKSEKISMPQIITLTSMCAVDEVARTLKRETAGIDSTDEYGNTPLHIAFSMGNSSLIKILIDAGADPTRVNLSCLRPRELAREEVKHEVCQLHNMLCYTFLDNKLLS